MHAFFDSSSRIGFLKWESGLNLRKAHTKCCASNPRHTSITACVTILNPYVPTPLPINDFGVCVIRLMLQSGGCGCGGASRRARAECGRCRVSTSPSTSALCPGHYHNIIKLVNSHSNHLQMYILNNDAAHILWNQLTSLSGI